MGASSPPFAFGGRNPLAAGGVTIHGLSFSNALGAAIRAAHSRIWVASYVVNCNFNRRSDPVRQWVYHLAAAAQGAAADVRFLLDLPKKNRPNYDTNSFFCRWFTAHQVPVKVLPPALTAHGKLIILDNQVAFLGSHNWVMSSLKNPSDLTCELRAPALVAGLVDFYAGLWHRGIKPPSIGNKELPAYAKDQKFDVR